LNLTPFGPPLHKCGEGETGGEVVDSSGEINEVFECASQIYLGYFGWFGLHGRKGITGVFGSV
jgi:hypothetical protein